MNLRNVFARRLDASVATIASLHSQLEDISAVAGMIVERLSAGGTLYTAGNGGSAAQALHLAEELIGRYRSNRPPLRAICLNADPTALTCIANDFGFDQVFARQCDALMRSGDVLMVMSTSGNSPNIANALRIARASGALTVGLLGKDGGDCRALCDHAVIVRPTEFVDDSAHIQEAHLVILHLLCEAFEPESAG